jgi:hypothetical protein
MVTAVAYYIILYRKLNKQHGHDAQPATTWGSNLKGKAPIAVYLFAIPLPFVNQGLSFGLYVPKSILWIIPEPRIEVLPGI